VKAVRPIPQPTLLRETAFVAASSDPRGSYIVTAYAGAPDDRWPSNVAKHYPLLPNERCKQEIDEPSDVVRAIGTYHRYVRSRWAHRLSIARCFGVGAIEPGRHLSFALPAANHVNEALSVELGGANAWPMGRSGLVPPWPLTPWHPVMTLRTLDTCQRPPRAVRTPR
jgi:hypothetical protein